MNAPLVVVSGPSGVGKSTVVAEALRRDPRLWLSVSATTRAPRPGEVDGEHYYFVSEVEFDRLIATDQLLEWAHYAGHRYGTPREAVDGHRAAGRPVILEIEVQGAHQVRTAVPDCTLIFLEPPSAEVLVSRLTTRGTESEADRQVRLAVAERELAEAAYFDRRLINDEVTACAQALLALIASGAPDEGPRNGGPRNQDSEA